MKALNENPDFQVLKQLIEEHKVKPLEKRLLNPGKPFESLSDVSDLIGQRKGMKVVFSFVDDVVKEKEERIDN